MRNHIHQHSPLYSRYSSKELSRHRDKRWYRALKATMNDEWKGGTPRAEWAPTLFHWLWSKVILLFGRGKKVIHFRNGSTVTLFDKEF